MEALESGLLPIADHAPFLAALSHSTLLLYVMSLKPDSVWNYHFEKLGNESSGLP